MDKLQGLSKGTQLLGASAVLLFIDLFFDWQQVCFGPVCGGYNGWHALTGVILGLATVAVIAWIAIRIAQPELLKNLPVPEAALVLVLGAVILLFALLKNLGDKYSHWPAYVGVILAAGVALGAWMVSQELGGAKFAMPSRPSEPASTPPPPPPAPEPTAPAAQPPPPEQTYSPPPPPPESPGAPPAEEQ